MTRTRLILNPQADHGHTGEREQTLRQLVGQAAEEATQQGPTFELDWVETDYPGHASELAEQAAKEGCDVVVAIGGDGTVHEVVNGLMRVMPEQRPRIGILPVGSGNDFAHNFGVPDSLDEAVRCLFGQQTRPIDVLSVTDGDGRQEYFNNTMGIGFSGAVNIATRSKKRWRGFMLYLVAVLETILFKPPAMQIECRVDDSPLLHKSISMFSMMNAGHLRFRRSFETGTARKLHIKSSSTMAIHIDGEVYGPWEADVREVQVTIIPGAIRILCGS
jgi:diacylglycerol kinase (ATP)